MNKSLIKKLCEASQLAGFNVNQNELALKVWKKGKDSHVPEDLPKGYQAVYIFDQDGYILKVGKVGPRSNPRYKYQHYNIYKKQSTLASQIKNNWLADFHSDEVGEWIKENTTRYNILIPDKYDDKFLHFAEAFFILNLNPDFEGRIKK